MSTAVLELKQRHAASAEQARADFEELLAKLLGEGPDDDGWALAVLAATGKTPEDLDRELARRRRVAELRKLLAGKSDLATRRRQVAERDAANKAYWKEAEARVRKEAEAIGIEEREIMHAAQALDAAQRELREICPLPVAERERQAAYRQVVADILRIEHAIGGRQDPDVCQAAEARHAARIPELSEKLDQVSMLNIFGRADAKHELSAAMRARDEAAKQAEKARGTRHLWAQLKVLRARHAELLAAAPDQDEDEEHDGEYEETTDRKRRRQPAIA